MTFGKIHWYSRFLPKSLSQGRARFAGEGSMRPIRSLVEYRAHFTPLTLNSERAFVAADDNEPCGFG
jgi:hypothetical protein